MIGQLIPNYKGAVLIMEQIFTILPLLLLLYTWGKLKKTFSSPASILISTWCIILFLQAFMAADFKFYYETGFILQILIISFFLGEVFILANKKLSNKNIFWGNSIVEKNKKIFHKRLLNTIILFNSVALFGSVLYFYVFYNYFGSILNLLTAGWAIRGVLADDLIQVPLIIRAMSLMSYTALIFCLCYWIRFGFKWFLIIPFLSMLIMNTAQAGRAGVLMMLISIFVAAYWRDKLNGDVATNYRFVKRIFKFTLVIMLFFSFGLAYREQNFDISSFGYGQLDSYRAYAFGAISGFAAFWKNYSISADLTYGIYSFSSLIELLGIRKLPTGFYDTYLSISDIGNDETNIYTMFRSVIDDFGVIGSVIYMFLMGSVMAFYYSHAIKGNLAALSFVIMSYTLLIYSVFAPLTQHNTILVAFILPPLIFVFFKK